MKPRPSDDLPRTEKRRFNQRRIRTEAGGGQAPIIDQRTDPIGPFVTSHERTILTEIGLDPNENKTLV